jgi:hypothetical protein
MLRPGEPPSVAVSGNTTAVSPHPSPCLSPFLVDSSRLAFLIVLFFRPRPAQTVAYLLKLPEHQETIEDFLTQLGDRKWLMGGLTSASAASDDEGGVLEHFVFDVVAALLGALEQRGKAMRKGVGAIFLVNNGQSLSCLLWASGCTVKTDDSDLFFGCSRLRPR